MATSNPSQNVDVGPAEVNFGESYLGETTGDTSFNYNIDTSEIRSEESGLIDEIVIDDMVEVTVPLLESDVDHLGLIIPWATIVEDGEEKRLQVGSAIGKRLSDYADTVTIHPISLGDSKAKDINIHKAYPLPGPLEFTYSREGQRVANVAFRALKDYEQPEGEEYFSIGDPDLTPVE